MESTQVIFIMNLLSTGVIIGTFVGYSRGQFSTINKQIEKLEGTTKAIQNLSERMAVVEKCTDHNATNIDEIRRVVDRRYTGGQ